LPARAPPLPCRRASSGGLVAANENRRCQLRRCRQELGAVVGTVVAEAVPGEGESPAGRGPGQRLGILQISWLGPRLFVRSAGFCRSKRACDPAACFGGSSQLERTPFVPRPNCTIAREHEICLGGPWLRLQRARGRDRARLAR